MPSASRSIRTSYAGFWRTLFAHTKDSLWSVDRLRCESILLRSHWVLVVIGVFTRRIIGFGIGGETIDGATGCRLFDRAIAGHAPPKQISIDHDPLFRFHQWLANLRILEVEEIKSVPYAPTSHPFIERSIETIRREYLDRTCLSNSIDRDRKLRAFQNYFNAARAHGALNATPPANRAGSPFPCPAHLADYAWKSHCRGPFETSVAA